MRYNTERKCITIRTDVETYIASLSNFLKSNDFYEYGFDYDIEIYVSIANVYSEYAAKRKKEDTSMIKQLNSQWWYSRE